MTFKIKHISFLSSGERQILKRISTGKFIFSKKKATGPSKWKASKMTSSRPLMAMEAVNHPSVRHGDPVVTLENGDKIRVFVSGDPSQMVVIAQSILENHDNRVLEIKNNKVKNVKKPTNSEELHKLFQDFPEW